MFFCFIFHLILLLYIYIYIFINFFSSNFYFLYFLLLSIYSISIHDHHTDYPCPLFSTLARPPVFQGVGHTIMNLLIDFRTFQYSIFSVDDLVIHVEDKRTSILIPASKHEQVRIVSNLSFIHPSIHSLIHQSIHLFIHLFIHPSSHLFIHPSSHLSLYPLIHPSFHSSIHPIIYPAERN